MCRTSKPISGSGLIFESKLWKWGWGVLLSPIEVPGWRPRGGRGRHIGAGGRVGARAPHYATRRCTEARGLWRHGVESPGERCSLGRGRKGAGHLTSPVAIGTVQSRVLEGSGNQASELGPESRFEGLQMPFPLPPLGATILEPDLKIEN